MTHHERLRTHHRLASDHRRSGRDRSHTAPFAVLECHVWIGGCGLWKAFRQAANQMRQAHRDPTLQMRHRQKRSQTQLSSLSRSPFREHTSLSQTSSANGAPQVHLKLTTPILREALAVLPTAHDQLRRTIRHHITSYQLVEGWNQLRGSDLAHEC